jgi:hypothetical protein
MGGIPIVGDLLAPPKPNAPQLPDAAPPSPNEVDKDVVAARQRQRRRAASLSGSTRKTGGQGLSSGAATTKKSLLGV